MSKGYGEDEKPGKEVDCRLTARKVEDSEERRAMRAPKEAGVSRKEGVKDKYGEDLELTFLFGNKKVIRDLDKSIFDKIRKCELDWKEFKRG